MKSSHALKFIRQYFIGIHLHKKLWIVFIILITYFKALYAISRIVYKWVKFYVLLFLILYIISILPEFFTHKNYAFTTNLKVRMWLLHKRLHKHGFLLSWGLILFQSSWGYFSDHCNKVFDLIIGPQNTLIVIKCTLQHNLHIFSFYLQQFIHGEHQAL